MFLSLIRLRHVTNFICAAFVSSIWRLRLTVSELLLREVFHYCIAVPQVLWIWEKDFFTLRWFLSYSASPHLMQAPSLVLKHNGLPSNTAAFTKFSLGADRSSSKVVCPLNCDSKHRPDPFVCLIRTVFSLKYFSVGSI